jgi:Transglycosylase SLT domain
MHRRQHAGRCRGLPRRPAVRIVAVLIVALLTAGCAAPLAPSHEPVAKQTTEAPTPTPVGKQTTEAPTPTRTKAPVKLTGAAVSVPRRVIMEQLAKRAERIAASMASASPEVLPTDVNPNSNRGLGYRLMLQFGVAADQWQYLDALWQRESGWNHLAENASSGAYGIPQSLPGSKMAQVAPDWRTNPETQITWGLAYIAARYSNPRGAWEHSQRFGWY